MQTLEGIEVKKAECLAPYVLTEDGKEYTFHPADFMNNFKKTLADIKKDHRVPKTLFLPDFYFYRIFGG